MSDNSAILVAPNTVVSLKMEMYDAHGVLLHSTPEPITYLHGGHGELLPALESVLEGKRPGEDVRVQLEPEDAFGEYDASLLRVEPVERYGEGLAVGMEVEDSFEGESRIYTVTDLADGKVVLDANHSFAGMALRFFLKILSVRRVSME
jgi:FKBP-type peptidyl-prolyl cis-trans isomerase SlyD